MVLRRGARLMWLVGGAAAAASVTGIVVSCLPDLDAVPAQTDSAAGLCGNGRIDIDAGEQCDPGTKGSVPGCSHCQLQCDAGEGQYGSYVDPSSDHCYFLLSQEAGPFDKASACSEQRAHVVTLGTAEEYVTLTNFGNLRLMEEPVGFWLGVREIPPDAGADAAPDVTPDAAPDGPYRAVVDEPGFSSHLGECMGCFVPFTTRGGLVPSREPASCVSWSRNTPRWSATECDAGNVMTLCEREPSGSRSYPCGDLLCFDVLTEARQGTRKTYVWNPSGEKVTADSGASFCDGLSDAGLSSLVVFQTPQQREQIFYELMHLPLPPHAGPPTDFWVGLTSRRFGRKDGGFGPVTWLWDDGRVHPPLPWGDQEPVAEQPFVRAYASQTGATYDKPGTTYDTQLMHAQDPLTDGGIEVHAVLCQILE